MTDVAIRVENLSKRYRIGRREQYGSLRDTLTDTLTAPLRAIHRPSPTPVPPTPNGTDHIWALKDVSFEVKRGEVVGVIGRNGAGKSTLLKILSSITEPTDGCADLRGRVGSLLEVGTGFHAELTGRENIYLSGAILGMKKADIERKCEEIVAFAEVEEFLDTPVKHYSSGMYLRLAFAVAAHLEPEILLIDEVLAVGDAAFQQKCLGRMSDVASQGRTVLFVSHNLSAVAELCTRGLLLDSGRLLFQGRAADCITQYLLQGRSNDPPPDDHSLPLRLGSMRIVSDSGPSVTCGSPFVVTVPLTAHHLRNPWIFLLMEDFAGRILLHNRVTSRDIGTALLHGSYTLRLTVPPLWISPGVYTIYVKFLLTSLGSAGWRVESERLPLEVHGPLDHSGRAILSPNIVWSLHEVHA